MNKIHTFSRRALSLLTACMLPLTGVFSSAPLVNAASDGSYISADTIKTGIPDLKGRSGQTQLSGRSITNNDNEILKYNYNGDIYTANSNMYDYLSDLETENKARNSIAEGYEDPYVLLNWAISNDGYDIPLYFGCFYRGDSALDYNSNNKGDGWLNGNSNKNNNDKYKNFYWQANMSLRKNDAGNIRFDASVQGLVDSTLKDGTISQNGKILPYFSDTWADGHTNLVKYWHDIAFPFYGIDVTATNVRGDSNRTGIAKYYQFNSKELNLQLETNDSTKTGKYKETGTQIYSQPTVTDKSGTVCYLPFNKSNNVVDNNLAFGTVFDINFQIQSDGKVETVDSNGKGTGTYVNATFEFMGDDDVWVFIDDNLVLDLGGDHKDTTGIIDFAEKKAYANAAVKIGDGVGKDDLNGQNCRQITVNLQDVMSSDTFNADGTYNEEKVHTLKMFYMERGMYESDLFVRFNFSAIPNRNTLKIQEVTDFTGINAGLVDLTKKAADSDVFNYTVSNNGTSADDVSDSGILSPTYDYYQRENQGLTALLTGGEEPVIKEMFYLDTSNVLSGGNTWDNDAIVAAWVWADGDTSTNRLCLGEKIGDHLYQFSGFVEGSDKVIFCRLNTSGSYTDGATSWPSGVYNQTGNIDLKINYLYKTTDWTAASEDSKVEPQSSVYEKNFDPTKGDTVSDTNYIWTDEFAVKKSGDDAIDGMTGTTDSNGSFNLMYGTNDKESSAEFRGQFKRNSSMTVVQTDNLKAVQRDSNPETFSENNGRTVSEYYRTTVQAVDKGGYEITINDNSYLYNNTSDVPENESVQITETFTNTPKVYALTVTKRLDPNDNVTDNFTFKVQFTDIFGVEGINPESNDYQNIDITIDGNPQKLGADAEFTLTRGQIAVISGIPYGTKYQITESQSDNYQPKDSDGKASGTIGQQDSQPADKDNAETIINTRRTNTLTLQKELAGDDIPDGSEDLMFTFDVTLKAPNGVKLSDYAITGVSDLGDYNESEHTYHFTVSVSQKQSVTISGIPYGTDYTVSELQIPENWQASSDVTGQIGENASVAQITNTYTPPAPKYGHLTVSKNVLNPDGTDITDAGDKAQKFTFTVTLTDESNTALTGTVSYDTEMFSNGVNTNANLTFTNGVASFELADDESLTIKNIPEGYHYSVEEAINAAFDTTVTEGTDTGVITADETKSVQFTNRKIFIPYVLPEAGLEDMRWNMIFLLGGMLSCGLLYWYVNRRKVKL